MRIGQLAVVAEVSPDTIRFYERLKLLPAPVRLPSGYRIFGEGALLRLRLIRRLRGLGLSLAEIKRVLPAEGATSCATVRELIIEHRRRIAAQLGELHALDRELARRQRECSRSLRRGARPCPALDSGAHSRV